MKPALRCLGLLLVLGAPGFLQAALPGTLNYQGRLRSSGGVPVDSSGNTMVFTIYDSGSTALWTETWNSATQCVSTTAGLFNVILGTYNNALGSLPFDQQYYLGIAVNGDAEMTPRQPLTMAPYAFNAKNAQSAATLALPYSANVTAGTPPFVVTNNASAPALKGIGTNGTGVEGDSGASSGYGIYGINSGNGTGVRGQGLTGVAGTANTAGGVGVVADQGSGALGLQVIGASSFSGAANLNGGANLPAGANFSGGTVNFSGATVTNFPSQPVNAPFSITSTSSGSVVNLFNNAASNGLGLVAKAQSPLGIGVSAQGNAYGVSASSGSVAIVAQGPVALSTTGNVLFYGAGNSITFGTHVDFSGATVTGWNVPAVVNPPLNLQAGSAQTLLSVTNTGSGAAARIYANNGDAMSVEALLGNGVSGLASGNGAFAGVLGSGGNNGHWGVRGDIATNSQYAAVYGNAGASIPSTPASVGVIGATAFSGASGVWGEEQNGGGGAGVVGKGISMGVSGSAASVGGIGVIGTGNSSQGVGVLGLAGGNSGVGVSGTASGPSGKGVFGTAGNNALSSVGVYGRHSQALGKAMVAEGVGFGLSATASQASTGIAIVAQGPIALSTTGNVLFYGAGNSITFGTHVDFSGATITGWNVPATVAAPLNLTSVAAPSAIFVNNQNNNGVGAYVKASGTAAKALVVEGSAVALSITASGAAGQALVASGSSSGNLVTVTQNGTGTGLGVTSSNGGVAIVGFNLSAGDGVMGEGDSGSSFGVHGLSAGPGTGVYGQSTGGMGVVADGNTFGISATASAGNGVAVFASGPIALSSSGNVLFNANGTHRSVSFGTHVDFSAATVTGWNVPATLVAPLSVTGNTGVTTLFLTNTGPGSALVLQGASAANASTFSSTGGTAINASAGGSSSTILGVNSGSGIAIEGQALAIGVSSTATNAGGIALKGTAPLGLGAQALGLTGVAGLASSSGGIGVLASDNGVSTNQALKVTGRSTFSGGSVSFNAHVDFSAATITGWNLPVNIVAPLSLTGTTNFAALWVTNTSTGPAIIGRGLSSQSMVQGINSANGEGIFGQSVSGVGVLGNANSSAGVQGQSVLGTGVRGTGVIGVSGTASAGGIGILADNGGVASTKALVVKGDGLFQGGSVSYNAHVDFSGATVTGWNVPATVLAPLSLSLNSLSITTLSAVNLGSGLAFQAQGGTTGAVVQGNANTITVVGLSATANNSNFSGTSAIGLYGNATGAPAVNKFGVYGEGGSGEGVFGDGAIGVYGSSVSGGNGVFGQTTNLNPAISGAAVMGNNGGSGPGLGGQSANGAGVLGQGSTLGLSGTASTGTGVYGNGNFGVKGEGNTYGVYGFSPSSYGVYGQSGAGSASVGGVNGSNTNNGPGVYGISTNGHGVYGTTNGGTTGNGVRGETSTNAAAVYGQGFSTGAGVHGQSNQGNGVEGIAPAGNGLDGTTYGWGFSAVHAQDNSGALSSTGVTAFSSAGTGIKATGNPGVAGFSTVPGSLPGGTVTFNSGLNAAIDGESSVSLSAGVIGRNSDSTQFNAGVMGLSLNGTGVYGQGYGFNGVGGKFESDSGTAMSVIGAAQFQPTGGTYTTKVDFFSDVIFHGAVSGLSGSGVSVPLALTGSAFAPILDVKNHNVGGGDAAHFSSDNGYGITVQGNFVGISVGANAGNAIMAYSGTNFASVLATNSSNGSAFRAQASNLGYDMSLVNSTGSFVQGYAGSLSSSAINDQIRGVDLDVHDYGNNGSATGFKASVVSESGPATGADITLTAKGGSGFANGLNLNVYGPSATGATLNVGSTQAGGSSTGLNVGGGNNFGAATGISVNTVATQNATGLQVNATGGAASTVYGVDASVSSASGYGIRANNSNGTGLYANGSTYSIGLGQDMDAGSHSIKNVNTSGFSGDAVSVPYLTNQLSGIGSSYVLKGGDSMTGGLSVSGGGIYGVDATVSGASGNAIYGHTVSAGAMGVDAENSQLTANITNGGAALRIKGRVRMEAFNGGLNTTTVAGFVNSVTVPTATSSGQIKFNVGITSTNMAVMGLSGLVDANSVVHVSFSGVTVTGLPPYSTEVGNGYFKVNWGTPPGIGGGGLLNYWILNQQ